jgi:beta-lactamase superfamily II metal-dependent hydrolase
MVAEKGGSMSKLAVTLMDVGWGDSLLIESEDALGTHYALIDSNDTTHARSSYLFLKRFFERAGKVTTGPAKTFEFVMLTHSHADHASGLPRIIREFGADRFLHPNSNPHALLAQILRYQRRPGSRLAHTQAIDDTTSLAPINFGAVTLDVLWPPSGAIDPDENNNSIVLALTLGSVSFVLTGDATAAVWAQIAPKIPANTRVFQVPHHGARNGTFDAAGATPWLTHFLDQGMNVQVAMSSHIRPHNHPHPDVVHALQTAAPPVEHFRTDLHYHLRFETDGVSVAVTYSHV